MKIKKALAWFGMYLMMSLASATTVYTLNNGDQFYTTFGISLVVTACLICLIAAFARLIEIATG